MAKNDTNRGAERVARRTRQAVNAEQATKDALLTPPQGEEKTAAVAASKSRELAKFGATTGSTRKRAQEANLAKAKEEAATLAVPADRSAEILAGLVPGEQPTDRQLRLLAKQQRADEMAEAREIGQEAGRMVRDALLRGTGANRRYRRLHQRVDQAARQRQTANATR